MQGEAEGVKKKALPFFSASGTNSLHDIIGGVHFVAVGNGDGRNHSVVEAERTVATHAVEVRVLVVVVVMIVAVAKLIASAFAILNQVHEVLIAEERECPEDIRLVDGANGSFKFDERHWPHGRGQCLGDNDAIGSGAYAVCVEEGGIVHS